MYEFFPIGGIKAHGKSWQSSSALLKLIIYQDTPIILSRNKGGEKLPLSWKIK
jgi:hypothetical protein